MIDFVALVATTGSTEVCLPVATGSIWRKWSRSLLGGTGNDILKGQGGDQVTGSLGDSE